MQSLFSCLLVPASAAIFLTYALGAPVKTRPETEAKPANALSPQGIKEAGQPSPFRKDLPDLFARLGSETFAVREAAQRDIAAEAKRDPEALIELVKAAWLSADDPEIRTRCEAIIGKMVLSQPYVGMDIMDPLLGITRGDFKKTPEMDVPGRVVIEAVAPDSPASAAGLKAGDVIAAVDGKPLPQDNPVTGLMGLIAAKVVGSDVVFDTIREGEKRKVTVTLGDRASQSGKPGAGLAEPLGEYGDNGARGGQDAGPKARYRKILEELQVRDGQKSGQAKP